MNDPDFLRSATDPDRRALTLVVRCWHEHGEGGAVCLRGSVRDLSRGRAVHFEGLPALAELLRAIVER